MIVITVRATGTRTDDIDVQIYILLLITDAIGSKKMAVSPTKKAQSLIPLWGLGFGPLWFGGVKPSGLDGHIAGHKQLHDEPTGDVGHRAIAEDDEVASLLALETAEDGL